MKVNNVDGRSVQVEAGKWLQTVFINHIEKPFEEYDINYDFYLKKVMREIELLQPVKTQLQLF